MKRKILIGVSGWGRGHSTRCEVIGQQLIELGYEIKFLTDFQGYDYLSKIFTSSQIIKVDSYRPSTIGERMNVPMIVISIIFFKFFKLPIIANRAMQFIKEWQPDVILSDSELITGRFIKKLNLPTIYLSSLSFLKYCQLPFKLSIIQSLYVHLLNWTLSECANASLTIVCKMSKLQLREDINDNIHLLDTVLRPELEQSTWEPKGTHILLYLRGSYITSVLLELEIVGKQLNREIFVYGAENMENTEHLIFKPISGQGFMRDMLAADYVVCTSGNQIIGELAYLGIPTLLIPETGQFEQEFNTDLACDFYKNMAVGNFKTITSTEIITKLSSLKAKSHSYIKGNGQKAVALIVDYIENIADN